MISHARTAGLALVVLGYAARRAAAVDVSTCPELLDGISQASTPTTITIIKSFECSTTIVVEAGQEITVTGGGETITISSTFTSEATTESSLFSNEGTLIIESLTVDEVTLDEEATKLGVRAIYNTGVLVVRSSTFQRLSIRGEVDIRIKRGGVIFTETDGKTVQIEGSSFMSNLASQYGGAICAAGSDYLEITNCDFSQNEVDDEGDEETGRGGDVFAERGVELHVVSSNFTGSSAVLAGGSIWCCGATLKDSFFTNLETSLDTGNYGAVTSGLPGEAACPFDLKVENCEFSGCKTTVNGGKGGALAVFDTTTSITNSKIIASKGTGVLFESTSASSPQQLSMHNVEFNENETGATEFMNGEVGQGTALVLSNTGLSEGDDAIVMGDFSNVFCYHNEPYECEILYNLADVQHSGDQKCNVCNLEGEKQSVSIDDDDFGADDRSVDSKSSSDDSNQSVIIGLSLALGLTLVVIGALAVYKIRVRKNARRLMEDMGDGDL